MSSIGSLLSNVVPTVFGGVSEAQQQANEIHARITSQCQNVFASMVVLALAGARKSPETRLRRGTHYWEIDDVANNGNKVGSFLPSSVLSITQSVARTLNGDGREKLREYDEIMSKFKRIFPINSQDPSYSAEIKKIWELAEKGLTFLEQTYQDDKSDFKAWLPRTRKEIDKYLAGASNDSAAENLPFVPQTLRNVVTLTKLKSITSLLNKINRGLVTDLKKMNDELASIQKEFMTHLDSHYKSFDFAESTNDEDVDFDIEEVESDVISESKPSSEPQPASPSVPPAVPPAESFVKVENVAEAVTQKESEDAHPAVEPPPKQNQKSGGKKKK